MRRTELGSRAVGRRSMTTGLLLSLSLACVPFVVWSFELGEPTFQDRQISKAIASRMPLYHLSNRVMDDEISREGQSHPDMPR